MNTRPTRRAAVSAVCGTVLLVATLAGAAAPAGAAPSTSTRAAPDPSGCHITPAPGVDAVAIRQQPDTSAPVDGTLYAGQSITTPGGCATRPGGPYSDCGGGDRWTSVAYLGRLDWAADNCVILTVT